MTLTQDQAKKTNRYYSYTNGDWAYMDEDGFWHLFHNKTELTAGMKTKEYNACENGDYECVDTAGYGYIFRDGKKLAMGIIERNPLPGSGDWESRDKDGKLYPPFHNWEEVLSLLFPNSSKYNKKKSTTQKEE